MKYEVFFFIFITFFFQNDEFLYPDIYRKLNEYYPRIKHEYLEHLSNALRETL